MGNDMTIDSDDNMIVSGKPPQRSVVTLVRPNTLPYINAKKVPITTTHSIRWNGRWPDPKCREDAWLHPD